ncbi:MAG: hypothetical protein RJA98_3827 [Pseudomonadota bacterium]|jgi:hypothetical protein
MSAAGITPEACLQPELLGLPPAPVQTPARAATEAAIAHGCPLRLCVMGRTVGPATVREGSHGAVYLEALIEQDIAHHPQALRLWASHRMTDMGSGALTIDRARKLAARMPTGTSVIVVGSGLETCHQAGQPRFRLLQVMSIAPEVEHLAHIGARPAPTAAPAAQQSEFAC